MAIEKHLFLLRNQPEIFATCYKQHFTFWNGSGDPGSLQTKLSLSKRYFCFAKVRWKTLVLRSRFKMLHEQQDDGVRQSRMPCCPLCCPLEWVSTWALEHLSTWALEHLCQAKDFWLKKCNLLIESRWGPWVPEVWEPRIQRVSDLSLNYVGWPELRVLHWGPLNIFTWFMDDPWIIYSASWN